MSDYIEAHRDEYNARLLAVSRDDDWTGWSEFFLRTVRAQAEDSLTRGRSPSWGSMRG